MGAILPFPGNIWHCLETSVSQLGMGGGGEQGYWRLVSRGQNCFQTSYNAQHSPLQQRIIQPQKPVVLRWRNPVLQPHFAGGGAHACAGAGLCVCARTHARLCWGRRFTIRTTNTVISPPDTRICPDSRTDHTAPSSPSLQGLSTRAHPLC